MSMTKKDFVALADALRPMLAYGSERERELGDDIVGALVGFMRSQNSQFKEDRWRAYLAGECGPGGGTVKRAKRWPGGGPILPGDR